MYPNYTAFDCETTGATNDTFGNPFTDSNRLVVVGVGNSQHSVAEFLDFGGSFSASRDRLEEHLRESSLLVGFNPKFDLHWLRRYGIAIPADYTLWDCQLAEFIIEDQQNPLPSLERTINKYSLGQKYTDINKEYWDRGIDTDAIPRDIVETRVRTDVQHTGRIFELQVDYLRDQPRKKRLIWLACQDIKILQEMEWNGLKYDLNKSIELGDKLQDRVKEIEKELYDIIPIQQINWASPDHLSAILYGGMLSFDAQEEYIFNYKDGRQVPKKRWKRFNIPMPRLVDPLPKTELKKEGFFSTNEGTLSKLHTTNPQARRILRLIKELRVIEKKIGTYFHGLPKLYKEMEWTNSMIHGQFSAAVAASGRLASSKPNQQNLEEQVRQCIVSRFN